MKYIEHYQNFINAFTDKQKPIAIYGTGLIAEDLLEQIADYNIIGILDKEKIGEFHGYPIISLEDIVKFGCKDIILFCSAISKKKIYYRISYFCRRADINVYDLEGNDLHSVYFNETEDILYSRKTFDDLRSAVMECDIVSFDIFDTLISRNVLEPLDIFDIVEKRFKDIYGIEISFAKERICAEQNCYKKGINPTIYHIYDELNSVTVYASDYLSQLLALEIQVEKEYICPRKEMMDFFNELCKVKPVFLISDMYLPSDTIVDLLKICGCACEYRAIMVSCEYGVSKSNGLYNEFIDRYGRGKSICHIGDNYQADYEIPIKMGLNAFYIKSAYEIMRMSSLAGLLSYDFSISGKVNSGYLKNCLFGNPFCSESNGAIPFMFSR